jgi:hypothetical protein
VLLLPVQVDVLLLVDALVELVDALLLVDVLLLELAPVLLVDALLELVDVLVEVPPALVPVEVVDDVADPPPADVVPVAWVEELPPQAPTSANASDAVTLPRKIVRARILRAYRNFASDSCLRRASGRDILDHGGCDG